MGLNDTPGGNRVRIAFFGMRNVGKSTLVNAFCRQEVAIVSDVPGTTTDPVSKAMEILPLGPCLVIDTAGLDDEGALGGERVRRSLAVLSTADIAVWVEGDGPAGRGADVRAAFEEECRRRSVPVVVYRRGDSVDALRDHVASVKVEREPGLLDGLVSAGDRVVCVCPIDESAPKGRLILPQVQTMRDSLDRRATCSVCQPGELPGLLAELPPSLPRPALVVTDS
ncbi:MAG: 50S ribosome-binding GTPase, partial [Kiritimatiellae bacterium]|nr:50S ribosome-binding GTPase [Kiritimatiellia bacterium]